MSLWSLPHSWCLIGVRLLPDLPNGAEPFQEGQEDRGPSDRGVGELEGGGIQDPKLLGPVPLHGNFPLEGAPHGRGLSGDPTSVCRERVRVRVSLGVCVLHVSLIS